MTSNEVRKTFLEFFKSKNHLIVSSAPIVVKNDPSDMFTNAGMNQFKDYFLGNKTAPNSRVADTQKCLRVSGKHNDLEEVGVDTYHHTMFEMMGNWSFGDYFKNEAIELAWELLVDVYKLDEDRLYVTVFQGDASDGLKADLEAENIWKQYISPDRIIGCDKKDNFWEMGETGPCGSCSEIHVDLRPESARKKVDGRSLVNADHPQVIELWNLVFIEYDRKADGSLKDLPSKHIDTGMGLERLVRAINLKSSNYDTDLFQNTIDELASLSGKKYGENEPTDIAFRVVADHIRALAFCIADGQLPSNTGAGYVIRRILRRAVRYGYSFLGFEKPFLNTLIPGLAKRFKVIFPELNVQMAFVQNIIKSEEASFLKTLGIGIMKLDKLIGNDVPNTLFTYFQLLGFEVTRTRLASYARIISREIETDLPEAIVRGLIKEALYIHDLNQAVIFSSTQKEIKVNAVVRNIQLADIAEPVKAFVWSNDVNIYREIDLTELLKNQFVAFPRDSRFHFPAQEIHGEYAFELFDTFGFPIDLTTVIASEKGITIDEAGFKSHLDQQKNRSKADAAKSMGDWTVLQENQEQEFIGYDHLEAKVSITRYRSLTTKGKASFQLVFNVTPFYGESGGQVGDTGFLTGEINGERIQVLDTQKENDLIVHVVNALPTDINQTFTAGVDDKRRSDIVKNHSATHLMHSALKLILGDHVNQKGSLVDEHKLRFDFSHFQKPAEQELLSIEKMVNSKIREATPLWEERTMPYAEAIDKGVTALFGEKYGDVVRVVVFDDKFSMELCGGTHVANTSEISGFKIVSESSIASGVRRIEAITGDKLTEYYQSKMDLLNAILEKLEHPEDVIKHLDLLLENNAILSRKMEELETERLEKVKKELLGKVKVGKELNILIERLNNISPEAAKNLAFQIKDSINSLFLVLATDFENSPGITVYISENLIKNRGWQAGNLVREWGKSIKGGGGGQPFFAQAGGKDTDGLDSVIKMAGELAEVDK